MATQTDFDDRLAAFYADPAHRSHLEHLVRNERFRVRQNWRTWAERTKWARFRQLKMLEQLVVDLGYSDPGSRVDFPDADGTFGEWTLGWDGQVREYHPKGRERKPDPEPPAQPPAEALSALEEQLAASIAAVEQR